MASFYQYHMWSQDFQNTNNQTQQQLDSCDSTTILDIHLQFKHFLELYYPETTHVLLTTTHNSYPLPRPFFHSPDSCRTIIQTILSNTGVARDFIDAVTHDISSFAFDMATTGRPDGVLTMVLDIRVVTPFDDRQVIDQALSEFEAMLQDGSSVKFKPASKSCIEGLKRLKLDEEGLCCGGNSGLVEECVICLEEFLVGDEVMVLPCGHAFHGDCGVKWLQTSHLCPLCRFEML